VIVGDVLHRLDGVRLTRRGWAARCPSHRDRSPSLSIVEGTRGWPLFHCFAGCTRDEIVRALGLDDPPSVPGRERIERETVPTSGLGLARRQAWFREEIQLNYLIADRIRHLRHLAARRRRAITCAGESEAAWVAATEAAELDREAERLEQDLEDALV
jgi:hypothetical protein